MQKGTTLIELIVYIAIVAGFLAVAVNFSWEIIYGNVKSQTMREVQQNSRFAMEKVVSALKNGEPAASFGVSNNILEQNGIALTTERVRVTNFQISSLEGAYKINLTIEHINQGSLNQYEASLNTETTVSLRN
ncbi:MAG: hypothetical protein ABIG08_02370 [bacterium]